MIGINIFWHTHAHTYTLIFTKLINEVLPRAGLFLFIIYNKPTRCNSGSIVFINNYKYALYVSGVLCVHHQEHYKL